MLFPANIEEKIGYDRIRLTLKTHCNSDLGKAFVERMRFDSNRNILEVLLRQTAQMMNLITIGADMPSLGNIDAFLHLDDGKIPGSFLNPGQLHELVLAMEVLDAWIAFIRKYDDIADALSAISRDVSFDKGLIKEMHQKIDEKGEVRDNASRELANIRSGIISEHVRARKTLGKIVQSAQKNGQSPEDASLTVRSGRLVIPIKAEFKRSFNGFIHDESASGTIAYIEPAEVLEINNHIKELEYQEKREIVRILTRLTDLIRPAIPALAAGYRYLGKIDFIHAKARYALQTSSIVPELSDKNIISWINARHPLLEASLVKQQKKIVPLNILIDDYQRIMVISGPNAGGKSVCLKTIGLLQYMLQHGMPIPVAEGSVSGIFRDLFLDIGDEQSIENDLSTYSSHLKNMAFFSLHAGSDTLFLIDEFGSGTDPHYGGAIAEAILEQLLESGARGLATTHYYNLKKYAESTNGVVNGRMRFDVKKLIPLYQLEIGRPGSSFSLEIAAKTGLQDKILKNARQKIGGDQLDLDKLLNELELEKKEFEDRNSRMNEKDRLLTATLKNYRELKAQLENEKKIILNKAREEAHGIIDKTNREAENLIKSIRENKAEKAATKKEREAFKSLKEELKAEPVEKMVKSAIIVVGGPIKVGDRVRIKETTSVGEVLAISKKEASIAFGAVKSKVKLERIEKIDAPVTKPDYEEQNGSQRKPISMNINIRKSTFSSELDLRGKRADSALTELVNFMDDAVMYSMTMVRIIHGKGNGILRKLVRDNLREHPSVRAVSDEHADRGGDGVSVVELK